MIPYIEKTKEMITTKGDQRGTINSLIYFLEKAKKKGATHYYMRWSNDPNWAFKWFETYREKSDEEIKQEKIKLLEKELESIKNE
jgi:hypothetical protein